jgi:hypothetical protein
MTAGMIHDDAALRYFADPDPDTACVIVRFESCRRARI